MAGSEQRNTAETVRALLELAGITRVLHVDDRHEPRPDEVAAELREAGWESLAAAGVDLGLGPGALPDQVVEERFLHWWSSLSQPNERAAVVRVLSERSDGADSAPRDWHGNAQLREWVGRERYHPLRPSDWTGQRDELLGGPDSQQVLVLLDRDLSKDGGGEQGGLDELSYALGRPDAPGPRFGLLTHTVIRENAVQEWQAIAKDWGLDRSRWVLVSKESLRPDEPMHSFTLMLKLMLMAQPWRELVEEIGQLLAESHSATSAHLAARVSMHDVDRMVFGRARDEGAWEADSVLRVYDIGVSWEASRRCRQSRRVRSLTRDLRRLHECVSATGSLPPALADARELCRKERYLDPAHLNANHLPTSLGDIYELTDGRTDRYILLAQPCDLVVRKGGCRANEDITTTVMLCGVRRAKERGGDGDPAFCRLRYYDVDRDDWCVDLRKRYYVPIFVLDFCVCDPNGESRMALDGDAPEGLVVSWGKRYEALRKVAKRLMCMTADLEPAGLDQISKCLAPSSPFGSGRCATDGQQVEFPCRRIGRVVGAYASEILLRFSQFASRAAFPYDLAYEAPER